MKPNSIGFNSPGAVATGKNNRIGNNCPGSAIIGGEDCLIPDWCPGVVVVGMSGFSGYSGMLAATYMPDTVIGLSGMSGAGGTSGFSGYSGTGPGTSGYSGYSGAGTSGYSGYSGTGTSGYSGYSGMGTSGYSGYSGYSGFSGAGDNDGGSGNRLQFNFPSAGATWLYGNPLYLGNADVFVNATGLAFFPGTAPAAQQGPLTTINTVSVSYSTPIGYAMTSPATLGGYGFANTDEADTLAYTIAKLTARVAELEAALQAYGLLA